MWLSGFYFEGADEDIADLTVRRNLRAAMELERDYSGAAAILNHEDGICNFFDWTGLDEQLAGRGEKERLAVVGGLNYDINPNMIIARTADVTNIDNRIRKENGSRIVVWEVADKNELEKQLRKSKDKVAGVMIWGHGLMEEGETGNFAGVELSFKKDGILRPKQMGEVVRTMEKNGARFLIMAACNSGGTLEELRKTSKGKVKLQGPREKCSRVKCLEVQKGKGGVLKRVIVGYEKRISGEGYSVDVPAESYFEE